MLLGNDINMRRRVYLALRMVAAFAVWLQLALILSRIGIFASTERSYSWQELHKWALNPTPLTEHQKLNLKLNLKYSLPITALLFSGVVARLLTKSLLL